MTRLRLREWTTSRHVELTPDQAQVLQGRFRCDVRMSSAGGALYDVTPRNHVGAVVVEGTAITIEPKLPVDRILFLLDYTSDPVAWTGKAELGQAPDVTEGVAGLFARLCGQALRGGLSGYRTVNSSIHTVRGRIDLAEHLRRSPGLDVPLAVTYQEYDQNILENQLLSAALQAVANLPIRSDITRRELFRCRQALADVVPVTFDRTAIPAVVWSRLNNHYRAAVELARLLLSGFELDFQGNGFAAMSLSLDMARLFEKFVRIATRTALGVTSEEFPAGKQIQLDDAGKVPIEPDLSLWSGDSCRFVGEIKYKLDNGAGYARHLYQLLAYATAVGLPQATLIYAGDPESTLTHHIPGARLRIHLRHLDLGATPTAVLGQIRSLADHVRETTDPRR